VSGSVTPAAAARAVLRVAAGAPPAAVAAAVGPDGGVARIVVRTDEVDGLLPLTPLQEAAVRLGRQALRTQADPVVEPIAVGDAEWLLYVEAHFPPEHLVIVGAGHLAVPLAHLGRLLDFRVTVLDDREEFATTERFDDDVAVLRTDFATDPFAGVPVDERTYLALVTRGHRWDFDCLQRLLAAGVRPRYIGMVGSRRRIRAAFHALLDSGVARSELARIHAPIGVEVGAETPAEIAVSIAAELVAVRRGSASDSMSAREQVLERFLKEAR
jgi:xanthine/CO dehydrogenase XdhC/CoxF family maturation factor